MPPLSLLGARSGLGRRGGASSGGWPPGWLYGAAIACMTSGCVVLEQTNGDEHIKMTGLFTNLTASSDCTQGDPNTGIVSQTHHTLTSNGDTATLHEAGGILGGVLAFASKFIPAPGGPAVRQEAVPSSEGSPAVTGCPGERTVRTPAQPEPPPPSTTAPFRPSALQEYLTSRLARPVAPGNPDS